MSKTMYAISNMPYAEKDKQIEKSYKVEPLINAFVPHLGKLYPQKQYKQKHNCDS